MRFGVLGSVMVSDETGMLEMGGAKQRTVLAMLVANAGRPVSVDVLMEAVYGETPHDRARRTIQTYVSNLRGVLGEIIQREGAGWVLRVDRDSVDALVFEDLYRSVDPARVSPEEAGETLQEALSLWRGPPYADVEAHGLLDAEVTRLFELRLAAEAARIDFDLARGLHAELIGDIESLLAEYPFQERFRAQHMLALYRAGRQKDALGSYQRVRELLAEELGVDPSRQLQDLEQQILEQDDSLDLRLREPADGTAQLPVQRTSFIGRDQELAELAKLLRGSGLVTVTGAGGSGKTRLALQAASDMVDAFADGIRWVELASLSDPGLVEDSVVKALGISMQTGRKLREVLRTYLSERQLLVVMDNCEHLVEPTADLVGYLLSSTTQARFLVTSRELLGVPGEVGYALAPMAAPAVDTDGKRADLVRFDSVRLFEERGQLVRTGFRVTDDNGQAVSDICRRLDGMPLAIELAAARLRILPPGEISKRLDDLFRLLTDGNRIDLLRHQTLEAAIDWSYDLLSENEKVLFRRLSVFSGGFALDAVEETCAGGVVDRSSVLELLGHLVDKSLVAVEGDAARYRLLETIRRYGEKKLTQAMEGEALRRRHAQHFLALAEESEPLLEGPDQLVWLKRLKVENGNLRAALSWFVENKKAEEAVRLAGALWGFWRFERVYREAVGSLEAALALSSTVPDSARAKALLGLAYHAGLLSAKRQLSRPLLEEAIAVYRSLDDPVGTADALREFASAVYFYEGNPREAEDLYRESLELASETAHPPSEAQGHYLLGVLMHFLGRFEEARSHLEDALSGFEAMGNRYRAAWARVWLGVTTRGLGDLEAAAALGESGLAFFRGFPDRGALSNALHHLGVTKRFQRHYATAAQLHEEEMELDRQEVPGPGVAMMSLGIAVRHLQDTDRATRLIRDGLRLRRESTGTVWQEIDISLGLQHLAGMLAERGDPHRAARLLGGASAVLDSWSVRMTPYHRSAYEADRAAIEAALGEETFQRLFEEGHAMTLDEAVAYALEA